MGGGGGGGEATGAETAIASTVPTASATGAGTTASDDAVAGITPGHPPALHVIVLVRFLFLLDHLSLCLFTLVTFHLQRKGELRVMKLVSSNK